MTLLLQSLPAAAANALAASIWQGLLLVCAVALCLRLLPRIPAAARSLVWTAVFVLVLLLPFLPATHTATHTTAPSAPSHALELDPRWSLALAALWLTLCLIRATQLLLSFRALRRLARSATPVANPIPAASGYTLCTSPHVDRPSVIGFFSRRILLPPDLYASLTPAELQYILLHETEHLRRRDDWTNLLQKLALVLVPLNPVLLWVERRLCLERELACDDRVLRATGARKAYATCLTHLAEHSLLRGSLTLALGFLGLRQRRSELTRRVHRILRAPERRMSPSQTAAATAALLIALAAGGWKLAESPQLLRFAAQPSQIAQSTQPDPALASSFHAAAFRTAAFRSPAAHATLVKAVIPSPASPLPAAAHRFPARPLQRVKRTLRPQQQPRINTPRALQAGWIYTPGPQRLVLTSASGDRVSYTFLPAVALAVPNGWIILQL